MSESKKNLLPQIFEPLAIVLILALFLIPTLTVLNLSPITQESKQSNVLGVTDSPNNISIELLNKDDKVFVGETLKREKEREYVYTTAIQPREKEREYSKQAFKIVNKSGSKQKLVVSGYTDSMSSSHFSLKIDGEWYVLRDDSKEMYKREIVLEPNATKTVYISTYSEKNILFKEVFTVNISVR